MIITFDKNNKKINFMGNSKFKHELKQYDNCNLMIATIKFNMRITKFNIMIIKFNIIIFKFNMRIFIHNF